MNTTTRITIPQDDFSSDSLGDLEALSSGMQSTTGVSLNQAVKSFMEGSAKARNAQASAEVAEEFAAILTYSLYDHLRRAGFECSILKCQGFKGRMMDCSPLMERAIREIGERLIADDIIHFVVRVGNIVLDLGYRRLGSEYLHSNNTVYNQFKAHWKSIHELEARNSRSPQAFLQAVRAAVNTTKLKLAALRMGAKSENDDDTLGDFGVVTAAAVVGAFTGAKRNRRLRVISTAKNGVNKIKLGNIQ